MISRTLSPIVKKKIGSGKAIIVIGPRQVGKTTHIQNELAGVDFAFFDGNDPTVITLLDTPNTEKLRRLTGIIHHTLLNNDNKLLHRIENQ
jgi:hypothetical protein